MSSRFKALLGPLRLPFLALTPACVAVGLGSAKWTGHTLNFADVGLVLAGALAAHVSVNTFNEYADFKSGLDFRTTRTPFSGGSGTLPQRPELARATLWVARAALGIAVVVGLYFVLAHGVALLPLGVTGLAVIVAYSAWIVRHSIACLIAPGFGFGPLMVVGTDFVLSGDYSAPALWASLPLLFQISNLLLLNQFPDVAADQHVGRRHLPIQIGARASSLVYASCAGLGALSLVLAVALGQLPATCLIALGGFAFSVPVFIGAYRHGEDTDRLIPYLGLNVAMSLAIPALIAAGLALG